MTNDNIAQLAQVPAWMDALLGELSCAHRRRIAGVMADTAACRVQDLLRSLQESSADSQDETELHIRIHHVCLPALDDLGLIRWDGEQIIRRDHPGWESPITTTLVQQDSPHVDGVIANVAEPQTRQVLGVLESSATSTDLDTVSRHLPADRHRDRTHLHHCILPRLSDADLLEYAPQSRRIQYFGDPLVEELLTDVSALS